MLINSFFNLDNRVQTLFEEALHPRPEVRGFTACRVKLEICIIPLRSLPLMVI